jgi:hypothetical protein
MLKGQTVPRAWQARDRAADNVTPVTLAIGQRAALRGVPTGAGGRRYSRPLPMFRRGELSQ